jgi:hypothetical protein
MKTNLLSCFILSFFIISFSSCNPKKALEDKLNETIAEKAIGAAMGTDVETSNTTNADKAISEIDLKVDGTAITYKNAKPIFTIAKGNNEDITCSISLVEEGDNAQRTIQIGLLGQKNLFKTPLTAPITTKDEANQVKAIFSIMNLSESGMEMKMTNSGTIKVISFSDEEVVFEIDAKGEELNESKTPFSIKGKIVCKNPMATYMGLKKEEIFN